MTTTAYISSISINHNDQDGVRVTLHLEQTERGFVWHDADRKDVGQSASTTVDEAENLAHHVWGADVWGLEFRGGTGSDMQQGITA